MGTNLRLHLTMAQITFGCWAVAFSVRALSWCPPCAGAACALLCSSVLSIMVWEFALLASRAASWAEWGAFLAFLGLALTLPTPKTLLPPKVMAEADDLARTVEQ